MMSHWQKRIGLSITVVLIMLLVFPMQQAWACSCNVSGVPETDAQLANEADAVFVGRVTAVRPPIFVPAKMWLSRYWPGRRPAFLFTEYEADFQVKSSWKSVDTKVLTVIGAGNCSYPFVAGDTYLIYAHKWRNSWQTSACSSNRPVGAAGLDSIYLQTVSTLPLLWIKATKMMFIGLIILVIFFFRWAFGHNKQSAKRWYKILMSISAIFLVIYGAIMDGKQKKIQAENVVKFETQALIDETAPNGQLGSLLVSTEYLGCVACHSLDGSKLAGPTFLGLFGGKTILSDGTVVIADEVYLREAILHPNKHIVTGYQANIMPEYRERVLDLTLSIGLEQRDIVADLIEFIKMQKIEE